MRSSCVRATDMMGPGPSCPDWIGATQLIAFCRSKGCLSRVATFWVRAQNVASPLGRVVEDDGAEAPRVARGEQRVGIDLVFPAEDVRVGLVCG